MICPAAPLSNGNRKYGASRRMRVWSPRKNSGIDGSKSTLKAKLRFKGRTCQNREKTKGNQVQTQEEVTKASWYVSRPGWFPP